MRNFKLFILMILTVFAFSLLAEEIAVVENEEIKIQKITGRNSVTDFQASHGSDSLLQDLIEFEEDGVKKIVLAWAEEGELLKNIYYSIKENKPDGKWSDPEPVLNTPMLSKTPHFAVDKTGIVHMVWKDGSSRWTSEIYHTTYRDKKWTNRVMLIPHQANDSFPRIDILENNVLNCVWECEIAPFDNTALVAVNTWTTNESVTQWETKGRGISTNAQDKNHATHVDIACRGLKSYAVWQEGEPGHKVVMFSEKIQKEGEDDHWSWPIRISTESHSSWPKIAVDSHNNVHVIWGRLKGFVEYAGRIFGEWKPLRRINSKNAARDFFEIAVDEDDTLHAAYRGDQLNTYYNVKSANNLGEWPVDIQISQAEGRECHFASIFPGSKGYVHITWCMVPPGASHSRDIYYATLKKREDPAAGYPEADFTMSAGPTIVKGMPVTFDASGSTSSGTISAYHWDFGDFFSDDNNAVGKVVTHTFAEVGDYEVGLAVLDKQIAKIGSKKVTMKVMDAALPPVNAKTSVIERRAFITIEWFNKVEWENNPQNETLGFAIEYYNIYRRLKGETGWGNPISQVSGDTNTYFDRGFLGSEDARKYRYGISIKAVGLDVESAITPTE
jgi:hypothetical protein